MPKPRECSYWWALIVMLAWPSASSSRGVPEYDQLVQRVMTLLPKPPSQVVIVDTQRAADDVPEALRTVDAFSVIGSRRVYLTSHNEILRGALDGWPMYEHMLAAIIWHEMAHIEGADEREAQRREEALWKDYMLTGRIDHGEGMRYLQILAGRRTEVTGVHEASARRTLSGPSMPPVLAVIEGRRKPIKSGSGGE